MTPSPHPSAALPPLPSLLASLDSVLVREGREVEVLEGIEATPLPSGRPPGCEFALDQYRIDLDALRHLRALVVQLAPHEVALRGLLAGEVSA